MPFGYFSPSWFFGYDIGFELICGLIALLLALFALRLSKITSERSVGLFGKGFLLISAAYFFQALFNFLMFTQLGEEIITMQDIVVAQALQTIGAYGHMIFMAAGVIVLLYMTFEVKKPQILAIMFLLALIPLILSENPFNVFYFITTICFAFVAWHFLKNYFKHRKRMPLITAIAFLFLLFGSLQFFFSINAHGDPMFYAMGHLIVLAAYLLIIINFYMVLKK
ncbi:Uncharacterised protein [uncultured archaeon]|nr:Uncharacterised protein [uncultured archaeon]